MNLLGDPIRRGDGGIPAAGGEVGPGVGQRTATSGVEHLDPQRGQQRYDPER